MAEAFRLAASVNGVACLGVSLSKHLYNFSSQTIGLEANNKVARIATNITLFATLLKHVAAVMQDSGSLASTEATETVKHIVRECEALFQQIRHLTELPGMNPSSQKGDSPGFKRSVSFRRNIKIYFEQPKIDALLSQLEYLKTTLSVLIQTLHLAAMTARINGTKQSQAQQDEQVQQERLHIETLVMARQLSVIVLQEHVEAHKRRSSAEDEEYVMPTGYISPSGSEATVELERPRLLTDSADSSLMLVRREGGHLEFLDTATARNQGTQTPSTTSARDSVVDKLLRHWTVAPLSRELPIPDPNSTAGKGVQKVTGLNKASPLESEGETAVSDTEESDAATLVPTSPSVFFTAGNSTLGPPPRGPARVQPGASSSSKTGSGQSTESHDILTQTRPSSRRLSSHKRLSGSDTGRRSATEPPILVEDRRVFRSPQPIADGLSKPPGIPPPVSMPSPAVSTLGPTRAASSGGITYPPTKGMPRPPQLHSDSESDSSIEEDSDDEDIEIPWRITIGKQFWAFLDNHLTRHNNPDGTYHWIWKHEHACTEIADHWVSEAALKEKKYDYQRVSATEAGDSESGGRWLIQKPLSWKQLHALVKRTNKLERQTAKPAARPPQAAITTQVPQEAGRQRSEPNVYFSPMQTSQPSYFAPQPPTQPRPVPPPSQWQSYGPTTTAAQSTLAPPIQQNQPRAPAQRNVSFSNVGPEKFSSAPRAPLRRDSTSDRSPGRPIDATNPPQPPQQPPAGYWPPQTQQQQRASYGPPSQQSNIPTNSYSTYPPPGGNFYPQQPPPPASYPYQNPNLNAAPTQYQPPPAPQPPYTASGPLRPTIPRGRSSRYNDDDSTDSDSSTPNPSPERHRARSHHGTSTSASTNSKRSSSRHRPKETPRNSDRRGTPRDRDRDKDKNRDRDRDRDRVSEGGGHKKGKKVAAAAGTLASIWGAVAGLEGLDAL